MRRTTPDAEPPSTRGTYPVWKIRHLFGDNSGAKKVFIAWFV